MRITFRRRRLYSGHSLYISGIVVLIVGVLAVVRVYGIIKGRWQNGYSESAEYIESRVSLLNVRWPLVGGWKKLSKTVESNGRQVIVDINPWNIEYARGVTRFLTDSEHSYIRYEHNLQETILKDSNRIMHGYAEVFIGAKPWGNQNIGNIFPVQIHDIKSLRVASRFTVENQEHVPLGMAYTIWLIRDVPRYSGVTEDEFELMIWLYNDGPIARMGDKIGSLRASISIDGRQQMCEFEVYYIKAGVNYFGFVGCDNYDDFNTILDLKPFIEFVYIWARQNLGYNVNKYFIPGLEMGTKYGSPDTREVRFAWEIHTFSVSLDLKDRTVSY